MNVPALILASNSPRRRQLLTLSGQPFTVLPANVDETPFEGETPGTYVLRLARDKGRVAAVQAPPGAWVIASDTTVADGTTLLGKPGSPAEARSMLQRLRGREHQVYTAIAILDTATDRCETELCCSQVPMRVYSAAEMDAYIASGDPLDKAGAYAIQHAGFHPVEHFAGCFASVMGLPLCHLQRAINRLGVSLSSDLPQACQAHLNYACPIWQRVQQGENIG
jgi:septum formation protein